MFSKWFFFVYNWEYLHYFCLREKINQKWVTVCKLLLLRLGRPIVLDFGFFYLSGEYSSVFFCVAFSRFECFFFSWSVYCIWLCLLFVLCLFPCLGHFSSVSVNIEVIISDSQTRIIVINNFIKEEMVTHF